MVSWEEGLSACLQDVKCYCKLLLIINNLYKLRIYLIVSVLEDNVNSSEKALFSVIRFFSYIYSMSLGKPKNNNLPISKTNSYIRQKLTI